MEGKKLTKRQAQANKTKNKIYDVSISLMEKKGFSNTTIEDICKKAGVSVGSFYHYYKSKEDIFYEIYKKADDYFENEVAQHLLKDSLNTAEQIILFFKYYAKYNKERELDNIAQLYNTQNNFFIIKGRYMQTLMQNIIKKGQDNNEITTEMTPEKITEYLFVVSRGVVYDWCIHRGEYDLEKAIEDYIKRFVETFKVDPSSRNK